MASPLSLPPGVAKSRHAVWEAIRTLQFERFSKWDIWDRLPNTTKFYNPFDVVNASRFSPAELAACVAENHVRWGRHARELRAATEPLTVELASVRSAPFQVGGEVFASASDAICKTIHRLAFSVVAATTQTGGISAFFQRVVPEWAGHVLCWYGGASSFFREHYNDDQIEQSVCLNDHAKSEQELEKYVQRFASDPVRTPEEAWERLANAPEAPRHLGYGILMHRYGELIEVARNLRDEAWIWELVRAESEIEHAKVAAASPTVVGRLSAKAGELNEEVSHDAKAANGGGGKRKKPGKRGPKGPQYDAKKDGRLYDGWKASGCSTIAEYAKKELEKTTRREIRDVELAIDRERKRRSRKNSK